MVQGTYEQSLYAFESTESDMGPFFSKLLLFTAHKLQGCTLDKAVIGSILRWIFPET